jgi:dTDP-4-amino-4,6-dideoxygalactose transaminase
MKGHPSTFALSRPLMSDASVRAASETLKSGWLGYGPRCIELESAFCVKRAGWALATQSCTAALWAAAMITKDGDEPEVIMPANTYIACAAAFQLAGWRIRLSDVDPRTGLLDLDHARVLASSATRALLVVDTYGQRFPEAEAKELCQQHGILLIRDAAHRVDLDQSQPPLADFVCYSFGPTKEIACPDGGLIWCSDPAFEPAARAITFWGVSQDTWRRSAPRLHAPTELSHALGLKLRMTDVNASIVIAQLADWPAQRERRRALASVYTRRLSVDGIAPLKRNPDDACLMAPVLVAPERRAQLRARLADRGVSTSDHYPSLTTLLPGDHASCPRAAHFCSSVIALPLHLHLSEPDVESIAAALRDQQ